MANPQKENGHLEIANEVAEALAKSCPGGAQMQVLWVVFRKTYGWNKKADKISISQIAELTGLSRRMVIYAIQNLEAKRMIEVSRKRASGTENEVNTLSFQKNYDLWVVQEKSQQYRKSLIKRKLLYQNSKNRVVQENTGSARNGKRVVQETGIDVPFLAPTKDTIQKTILQKTYNARFQKPTSEEVSEYAKSIDFILDGQVFLDFYEARGWKYKGGVAMKDWKAAVRTWKHVGVQPADKPPPGQGKCCTQCGGNVGEDGKVRIVMLWKENLPWCTLSCYEKWVRNGRIKK